MGRRPSRRCAAERTPQGRGRFGRDVDEAGEGPRDEHRYSQGRLYRSDEQRGAFVSPGRRAGLIELGAQDYVDACERLLQLGLTDIQQREIARVLLQCSGNVSRSSCTSSTSLTLLAHRRRPTTRTTPSSRTAWAPNRTRSRSHSNTASGTSFANSARRPSVARSSSRRLRTTERSQRSRRAECRTSPNCTRGASQRTFSVWPSSR